MKTIFSLTALFYTLLLCAPSFAQKKNVPGFYISMQGDTVKGVFPSYSQWNKNPSEIEFATGVAAKKVLLTPQECQKIVIEDYDEYLPYSGPRMVNPIYDEVAFKSTSDSSAVDRQEEVVTFLRLVTRTPGCELYAFNDSKRINFFYKLPGQPVVELKYKKYCLITEVVDTYVFEVKNIITTSEYKDQLNSVFGEVIEKQNRSVALQKLQYSEHDLKSFLEELFAVKRGKYRRKNQVAGWIISAGTAVNFVDVKAEKSYDYIAKQYSSSTAPLLSIGYLAPVGRNFNKYFLMPQVDLFRYKNTGEVNDGTFRFVTTYQTDLVIAAVVNGGVNIVNNPSIRFYLAGGPGMLTLLNNRRLNNKYLNSQTSDEPYRSSQTPIALKMTSCINASAGMVIKNKVLLAAAYLFRTQIDNAYNYTPRYSSLQLKIGYKL